MLLVEPVGRDIFDFWSDILVNPVNCIGVPGAGLAKVFAEQYPNDIRLYKEWCREQRRAVGDVILTKEHGPWIIHAATKFHFQDKSTPEGVGLACENIVKAATEVMASKVATVIVAVPALGCGLGKLSWSQFFLAAAPRFSPPRDIIFRVCPPRSGFGSPHASPSEPVPLPKDTRQIATS